MSTAAVHDDGRPPTASNRVDLPMRLNFFLLLAASVALLAMSWFTTDISADFALGTEFAKRPILTAVAIFTFGFLAHLLALGAAVRLPSTKTLGIGIVLAAALFRIVLLFSNPIQEIDLYRYLWDGGVLAQGINPYKYSPDAAVTDIPSEEDQGKIKRWLEKKPAMREVRSNIHFRELSTVYPPISQVFFSIAYAVVPPSGTVTTYVRSMKAMIIVFDLATLLVVIGLLADAGRHVGWSILYGWSPLVLKEFANSGHLDSITIFFSVLAIYLLGRAGKTKRMPTALASAGSLGLSIGAKLYPVILVPLFVVYAFRKFSMTTTSLCAITLVLTTALALGPMFADKLTGGRNTVAKSDDDSSDKDNPLADLEFDGTAGIDAPDQTDASEKQQDSLSGLRAFLGRWEMNDLIFMIVEENIRPEGSNTNQPPLWFAKTPDSWRQAISVDLPQRLGWDIDAISAPFLITRLITAVMFLGFVVWGCWIVARNPTRLNEAMFMLLAWFWFLAPTQNPWYWAWALPLIPFARNRIWIAVGGLAMLYYLRFACGYHATVIEVGGSRYTGENVFHFFIVWLEHAPFLIALVCTSFWNAWTGWGLTKESH